MTFGLFGAKELQEHGSDTRSMLSSFMYLNPLNLQDLTTRQSTVIHMILLPLDFYGYTLCKNLVHNLIVCLRCLVHVHHAF